MRKSLLLVALMFITTVVFGQEHAAPARTEPVAEKAATEEAAAADPHAQFMESPSVKWIARTLGVETKTASKIALGLNFVILAGLFYFATRKAIPQMFRDRTTAIQKGMEEARKASAESAARLSEIESRLSRLDQDIATMRAQAESGAGDRFRRECRASRPETLGR
jgi:F-type H+-transporting ATPase subunit b